MAIFKSILGTVSGKSGNLIFSRNKGGQYIKEFKVPTNPKTSLQIAVRQIRSQTSKAWAALEQSVKDRWNSFAETNPVTNRLGDPIYLSGFGWFQKAGFNFVNIGKVLASIDTPNLQEIPEVSIASLTCDLLTGVIVTLGGAVPSTESCIVRGQVFNSAGVTNPGRLKQVEIFEADHAAALDITSSLASLFGTLTVGDYVFVQVFLVQESSGGAGPIASTGKIIITDTTP